MKVRILILVFCCLPTITSLYSCQAPEAQSHDQETITTRPNIIYILADDLGYGDLSCYGQQKFQTPNIDALAEGGMRFTQHYSGSTVCAPSRSALMTGLHTGHTPVRGNKEVQPEGQTPLPAATYTLAELFKDHGYATGMFGKWGLGFPGSEGDPNNQGIDEFYGYNCQRKAHNYYPYYLWHNQDSIKLEGNEGKNKGDYAPAWIQEQTLAFIEDHQDEPFFLYVPHVIPHAELVAPEEEMARFRGKFDPETPYEGYDEGENYRNGPYESQEEPHAAFAAMVSLLDQHVGEIVAKLTELNLDQNTLIIFTSDNGPHLEAGADPDYFDSNGPLKGYKRDLYEGGIRVPMIANWPGVIAAGSTSDHISAFWDFYPTAAELMGAEVPTEIDGISYAATLRGAGNQEQHDYLYWEFHEKGGRIAMRQGKWKAVQYDVNATPDATPELYDLSEDLGEETNLADQYPDLVQEMKEKMINAHVASEVFPFGKEMAAN